MYYPQEPREPSGCMQTWVITRVIFSLLFWPVVFILGSVMGVAGTLFLLSVEPILALIPVAAVLVGLWGFARWERAQAEKMRPPEE